MAITLKNAGVIGTNSFNMPWVGHRLTFSIYFRVNSRGAWGDQRIFSRGSFQLRTVGVGSVSSFNVVASGNTTVGNGIATKAGAMIGTVYHAVFVYDKDDPARRFLAVNTSKAPWVTTGSGGITGLNSLGYGFVGNDVTIQRAFFLDGYAATDAEVMAMADDVAAAPAVFAAGLASAPEVIGFYHSMSGAVGEDAHQYDPGLSYGALSHFATAEPSRPTSTDTVKYAAEMACRSEVAVERAYVGSSGRTLTVVMGAWDGSGRVTPQASGLAAPISIRVDGGPPIVLPTTAAGGAYAEPTSEGIFLPLPVTVAPSSVVTIDAPKDWFVPRFGYLPALTGHPAANYSGRPISEGIWPDAPPTRVGTNTAVFNASTTATTVIHKNRALSFGQVGVSTWPDGSIKGDLVNTTLTNSGVANGADSIGMAGKAGLYAIRWDDHDPAKPVTINLAGIGATYCTELTAYRNDGDALGRGKARVYDIGFSPWRSLTLRLAVDAATTTIPYSVADTNHQSLPGGVAVIDGEQIRLGTQVFASRHYINCTRGWNGTTAAAHAGGASISASGLTKYGGILVSIRGAEPATTRYSNFAAYGPDAWDLPATPGPLSLPPPDNMELDPAFAAFLAPGLGGLRPMSTSQGSHNTDVDQPELLVRQDDARYASERYEERLHVTQIRPYNMAASPYYYAHIPAPNSETYTAVLGAPIATAPPPGSIETITIAGGRSAPVLYGQVLWAGSEKMRVLKVPLSGDLYEVERGSEDTPTSTHPAGPITVGYRIPVTQESQYKPADQYPIHAYEMLFDEALSSPPRFGRYTSDAFNLGWDGGDDCNLDARLTLTLTAPFPASATEMTVSTASPGDWDRIAKRLRVVIGAETLTILSVNRQAGTIAFESRPAPATAHPAGATATTKSGGVLVRSADGTASGYATPMRGKSAMFPTGPGRALVTGSDSTAGVPVQSTAAFPQAFDPALARTKTARSPLHHFPYEFQAATTAKAPGAWHWVNVPLRASDAAVHAIAKATLAHFPPGRKVLFELCNETWNNAFFNNSAALVLSAACGLSGGLWDFPLMRSQSAYAVFKRVFEEAGRGDECVHVIAWQTRSDILRECRRLGVDPDGYAIAPYLHPPKTATIGAVWSAVDNPQMCDFYTFVTYYELTGGIYRSIAESQRKAIADHEAATGKRVLSLYYEGGLETIVYPGTPGDTDVGSKRQRDVVYDPAFYFTERDFYAAAGQIGGSDLYCQFDLSGGGQTKYWGLFRGPAQLPGYGDGRPGDVDNRMRSFVNPTDLTRGPDVENRSVRGQAMLDHQVAFMAAQAENPTGPEDPGPVDPGPVTPPPSVRSRAARRLPMSRFRFR